MLYVAVWYVSVRPVCYEGEGRIKLNIKYCVSCWSTDILQNDTRSGPYNIKSVNVSSIKCRRKFCCVRRQVSKSLCDESFLLVVIKTPESVTAIFQNTLIFSCFHILFPNYLYQLRASCSV